ncbi:recombinase family protein [Streptomyces vastus]|uniref:recombinase family protein n=1 Tax=Streptomyces vastus TaxID=285451 RepID=UPI0031DF8C0C
MVPSLDRLGRSIQDLISIVSGLRKRGIGFQSGCDVVSRTRRDGPKWPRFVKIDDGRKRPAECLSTRDGAGRSRPFTDGAC